MDDPVFRYDEAADGGPFFQRAETAFPPHFHEHYLFGLVEEGARTLFYKGCTYSGKTGALLAINPGDPHACEQLGPHGHRLARPERAHCRAAGPGAGTHRQRRSPAVRPACYLGPGAGGRIRQAASAYSGGQR